MSTPSSQCDELRELAAKYDEVKSGATRVVRVSLDTGSVLREAADTICELRDKAQTLQAENDRLRELASGLHRCLGDESCDGCPMLDDDGWCNRDNQLRELGIEADGETDATRTALLPCPFCGGEARIITAAKENWVLCDKCKASAEAHSSKRSAIAAWNRRAK